MAQTTVYETLAGVTIQPSDAFKQVRVPQPSRAQPGGSSWRNRFAASPVSHGLRHLASVGKSPPLRLTSSRSRGRACPVLQRQRLRVLHSRHAQAASPPCRRATLAGRTVVLIHPPAPPDRAFALDISCFDSLVIPGADPSTELACALKPQRVQTRLLAMEAHTGASSPPHQ